MSRSKGGPIPKYTWRGCAWFAGPSSYCRRAGCKQAGAFIKRFKAENLPADRGYDSDAIIKEAREAAYGVMERIAHQNHIHDRTDIAL